MSSLGCKARCIVIGLLVLGSISLSSSLVYFKNGTEYLNRETAQVFIRLMGFPLYSLLLSTVLVLLKCFFFIFFLSSTHVTIIPRNCKFSCLECSGFCRFGISMPSISCLLSALHYQCCTYLYVKFRHNVQTICLTFVLRFSLFKVSANSFMKFVPAGNFRKYVNEWHHLDQK